MKFPVHRKCDIVLYREQKTKKGLEYCTKIEYCALILASDTTVLTADICYDEKHASCDRILRAMRFETMPNAYPEKAFRIPIDFG